MTLSRESAATRRWDVSIALKRVRTFVGSRALPSPLIAICGVVGLVLIVVSTGYGFHRDELYFIVAGSHPAFGYVDQPPLTPLISAAMANLLGVSPTAIRLLPALAAALVVVLTGLMARELGGSGRAQVLASMTAAVSGVLAEGHLDHTTTYDLLAWAVILWLVIRLLAGADRRLWLAVGLAAGVALENKDTPIFLAAGLAVGLVLARRWEVLVSRWTWAGLALALPIWLPNLVWQAGNGFPEITMAHAIAGDTAANRVLLLPMLLLFAGPLLFPVSIAGLGWLLRSRAGSPWRALGVAFTVIVGLVLASGGKFYYAAAFVPVLIAAGTIVLDAWLDEGRPRLRTASFAATSILSGALMAVIVLPGLPPATLASTPIPTLYDTSAEQIGWPQFVSTVQKVVDELPADQRSHAVVFTSNYSEAAALELFGSQMPPVYSGHNSYWYWGPPGADRTTVIVVGQGNPAFLNRYFETCQYAAVVDNGYGLDNQEQSKVVSVCSGLIGPWAEIWPELRHFD